MATQIIGNKFLILNFGQGGLIRQAHPNIKVISVVETTEKQRFEDDCLFLPITGAEKLLQKVHAALTWAAEYRSVFNWDFVIKLDNQILDCEKLLKMQLDERVDVMADFNQDGNINGGFWIAGPRVVETYIKGVLPVEYYNSETWYEIKDLPKDVQQKAIPEHRWFWQQAAKTIPFARVQPGEGIVMDCKHASAEEVCVQLRKYKSPLVVVNISNGYPEVYKSLFDRKIIEDGSANVVIVIHGFGAEIPFIKPCIDSARTNLLAKFSRRFVVMTDDVNAVKNLVNDADVAVVKCGSPEKIMRSAIFEVNADKKDFVIYSNCRNVFIKPVNSEILPLPEFAGITTLSVEIPASQSLATIGWIPGLKDKGKPWSISSDLWPKAAIDPALIAFNQHAHFQYMWAQEGMFMDCYKQGLPYCNLTLSANWYVARLKVYPMLLPSAYNHIIKTENNDLRTAKIVRDYRYMVAEKSMPGHHVVRIGGSVAKQIESIAWFFELQKKYPNAEMWPEKDYAWDVFKDRWMEFMSTVAPRADLPVVAADKTDGLMQDSIVLPAVVPTDEVLKALFVDTEKPIGLNAVISKFIKNGNCAVMWMEDDSAPDYESNTGVKFDMLFVVTNNPDEEANSNSVMQIAKNSINFEMLSWLADAKTHIGTFGILDKSSEGRIVQTITKLRKEKK